jgi:hypothetical protein
VRLVVDPSNFPVPGSISCFILAPAVGVGLWYGGDSLGRYGHGWLTVPAVLPGRSAPG